MSFPPRPAFAATLAAIDRQFGEAAIYRSFKARVRFALRHGAGHPAVRARYAGRGLGMRGFTLDRAILYVERWYRDERKAFQVASAYGRGTRLSVVILEELRLLLRWLRLKNKHSRFREIVADLLADDHIGQFEVVAERRDQRGAA